VKRYLWWWVVLLAVFVIAAKVSGNGSTAWAVTQYIGFAVLGVVACVFLLSIVVAASAERRQRKSGK
jgi:hypothetical protein